MLENISQRLTASVLWLTLLSFFLVYCVSRVPHYIFDSSLLSLLPAQSQGPMFEARAQAQAHLADVADKQWLVLVGHTDRQLSARLAEQVKQTLVSPNWRFVDTTAQLDALTSSYWPYRYFLVSNSDAQLLAKNPQQLVAQAQQRLYSPLASVSYDPVGDPLFIFQNYMESLALKQPVKLQDGWPTLLDNDSQIYYRMLRFELSHNAFAVAADSELPAMLEALRATLPSGSTVLTSGLIFHAAHGAQQARAEIAVIGVGSLVGVFLLLLLAFGWSMFPMLLPLMAGLLTAFSISLMMFERVHLITLAFGASLIGVGIDYAIHARMALNHGEPLASLKQPLLLGLLTSVLAYGLQGVMPFPGLRQMALFSCVGLIACWISVWLWFPLRAPVKSPRRAILPVYYCADAWLRCCNGFVWPTLLKTAVFVIAVISLLFLPSDDRVSQLQTSPSVLLQQEQQVNSLLQGPQPGRYFLVVAKNAENVERRLNDLVAQLSAMDIAHTSISQWLMPVDQQQRNRVLLQSLYQDHGLLNEWYHNLGASELLAQGTAQFDQMSQPLDLTTLAASPVGAELRHLVSLGENPMAMVYLQQPLQAEQLAALRSERWIYVDRAQELSAMLASHRVQLLRLLVFAIFFVCLLALVFNKHIRPQLFFAPVIAASLALWLVSIFSGGINLFHCLAVLLVLGVGFDNSLILSLSRSSQVAWRGATVSVLTSMLAFGLLAACATPVLKSFGVVAALGLLLVWLLVPIMAITSDSPLRN